MYGKCGWMHTPPNGDLFPDQMKEVSWQTTYISASMKCEN